MRDIYKIAIFEDDNNYCEYLKKIIVAANILDDKNYVMFTRINENELNIYADWEQMVFL